MRLRTKFLLSLVAISASLTWVTLLIVRQRVQVQVREGIFESLRDSVSTFQRFQQDRERILAGSTALMADVPPIRSLMTSEDEATIQDASVAFWHQIGSGLFVLADRTGKVMALDTDAPGFRRGDAQKGLNLSVPQGRMRDWWFGGGHLFEVFLHPIYFGSPTTGTLLGTVVVGDEIDDRVAAEVSQIASSQVAFRYGNAVVASTLPLRQRAVLAAQPLAGLGATAPVDVRLGPERFLASSVELSPGSVPTVSLTVLKSYDEATSFLRSLNRWILSVGFAAVVAGTILVFLISTTFTRPLADLVEGVRALEKSDFAYPLKVRGADEVSELTRAFDRMRRTLEETQQELLRTERLATIGRMASTISHDLRHPLTVILAYAEFLAERPLADPERQELYREIRLAVDRMTEQISSLLNFSKQGEVLRPVEGCLEEVIGEAIQSVHARPEFHDIPIALISEGSTEARFDPRKMELVFHNLLLNACEAVPRGSGRIEITTRRTPHGLEVRVADNGRGIPEEIRDRLFHPFVSCGKQNGFGLGLTIVQKIIRDHGGDIHVESTGASGTVFCFTVPHSSRLQPVESDIRH